MARPNKTGLDYFPFDVDFFDDERIICVEGEYGIKGSAIVLRLLCAVYRNGYFALWDELLRARIVRQLPGVSVELVEQVLAILVKWGFFDKSLFNSDNVLTSAEIQRVYFEAVRKRKIQGDLPYLLVSAPETQKTPQKSNLRVSAPKTGVSAPKTPISAGFSTQSKVNKREINFSPPNSPPKASESDVEKKFIDDFFSECNFGLIEQFCKSARIDDTPPYANLRSEIESISANLRLSGEFQPYESSWRRSVMNICRYNHQQKQHHEQTNSNKRQRLSGSLAARLPKEPDCGIIRRPNSKS